MNSKERFISALRNEPVDYVPVVPKIWVDFAARVTKVSLVDVILEPLTALRVIALAGRKLQLDAVRQFPFPPKKLIEEDGKLYEIENDGRKKGTIDINGGLSTQLFSAEDYRIDDPYTIAYCHSWSAPSPLVNSMKDAERIAVPNAQVFDDLGWGDRQRQVIEEFGEEMCFIGDCDSATMSFYVVFRGIENAMYDLITQPKLVHAVMEKGTQVAIARGKYWLDNNIQVLRLNDSMGNMSLISPQHWNEFIFPYIKTVCDELHSYKRDALIYCHICGNVLPIVELLVESGLDCIGPLDPLGGFTVKQVRDKVGSSVSLMGGVNTLTLLQGTPNDVKAEAIQCIEGAGDKGGFVLGSGCVVPRDCPVENLLALVQATK